MYVCIHIHQTQNPPNSSPRTPDFTRKPLDNTPKHHTPNWASCNPVKRTRPSVRTPRPNLWRARLRARNRPCVPDCGWTARKRAQQGSQRHSWGTEGHPDSYLGSHWDGKRSIQPSLAPCPCPAPEKPRGRPRRPKFGRSPNVFVL